MENVQNLNNNDDEINYALPRLSSFEKRKSVDARTCSPSPKSKNKSINVRRNSSFGNLVNCPPQKQTEYQKIISHISNQFEFVTPKKKNNLGSLYNLFASSYFNINLLIYYLYEKDHQGISDILINIIRGKFINQTFFYIPQLLNLISLKTHSESLEEFVLDCCVDKIKFSLIVTWQISNNIKKAVSDAVKNKFSKLNSKIEMTLVNTKRQNIFFNNSRSGNSLYKNVTDKTDIKEIYKTCVNKEYQITYFEENVKVFNHLKIFCEKLKEIENKNDRTVELRQFLNNTNKKFKKWYQIAEEIQNTINVPTKNLFRGIILPFDDSSSVNDNENNLIVNFVAGYSTCFNTKKRVPVKLVVECVRAYECENWDKLYCEKKAENEIVLNNNYDENDSLCDISNYQFNPFNEKWSFITSIVKSQSSFQNFKTHSVKCFIFKTNDDLSQESMIMQLIKLFYKIFKQKNLPLKLTPYDIVITSPNSGLIEYIPNSVSIDTLKRKILSTMDLNDFFRNYFCNNFEEAQKNFVESLAGYSLISYIINIKDRHNGNILLDDNGNIIHIDFGFVLGVSPGGIGFENSPFKLTQEYIDIMDGKDSAMFHYFKSIFLRGLIEVRKYVDDFTKIIEIMGNSVEMPCFNGRNKKDVIEKFKEHFHLGKSELECVKLVDDLIEKSAANWRTIQYDNYQKLSNGILP